MKKQKYDLIFSLGAGCPTSMLLRKLRVQKFSYPFDWIGGQFHVLQRVDTVCHRFENFFNEKDLVDSGRSFADKGGERRIVLNTKTGYAFHHDFLKCYSVKEDFPRVCAKYNRRTERLVKTIQQSQKIMAVFQEYLVDTVPLNNDAQLIEAYQQLNQAYPDKQWHLLYFKYLPQMPAGQVKEEQISDFITKVSGNYKSIKPGDADWAVNEELLNLYYKKLKLKKSIQTTLWESLILSTAFLIPFRGLKRKFIGHFFKNYFEV